MEQSRTDFDQIRRELHEAINDTVSQHVDGATGVTGWVLIYETALGQSRRDLTAIAGDVIGENDLPVWTARGWLDEVREDVYGYFDTSNDWEGDDD